MLKGQLLDVVVDIVFTPTVDHQWKDRFYIQVEDYLHGRTHKNKSSTIIFLPALLT